MHSHRVVVIPSDGKSIDSLFSIILGEIKKTEANSMNSIQVMVIGSKGKMGKASVQAIENDADLNCVSQCDVGVDIKQEIAEKTPDVVLDFTHPNVVFSNAKAILESGKHAVIGTTGLTEVQLNELDELANPIIRGYWCALILP